MIRANQIFFLLIILVSFINCFDINDNFEGENNRSETVNVNFMKEIVEYGGFKYSLGSNKLDELFDVWNPVKLLDFWNQKTTNEDVLISLACHHDISWYLQGILAGENWALKISNADGRHAAGLFSGNRYWLGAADQCREMEKQFIRNDLDKMKESNIPPFKVTSSSVNLRLEIFKPGLNKTHRITFGLCLPSSCTSADITSLLNFYNTIIQSSSQRRLLIEQVRNLSNGYSIWNDTTTYIIVIALAFSIVLTVLGTCYDIALRYQFLNTDEMSRDSADVKGSSRAEHGIYRTDRDNLPTKIETTVVDLRSVKRQIGSLDSSNFNDRQGILSEALLSFSLLLNISKITSFEVGHDTLAPIHGLRFLTMLWIILVHTCLLTNEVADTNMFRMNAEQDFLYQTISNGTYAVDTFFFMSGCLVTFLYFRTMMKRGLEDKKITKGIKGKGLQFFGMMIYRYLRLTPPYLLMIGIIQLSMKWHRNHSMIQLPARDDITCEKFWWRNALYINTYFPPHERCMVWSWYLADDTQFYTIGIIILIVGAKCVPIGAWIGGICLIASWITAAVVSLYVHHIPTIEDPFAHYESLYDKPTTRIGPYLIGMATGWYLYNIDCKLKINKVVKTIGWIVSITTMLSIVYGLYWRNFDLILSAFYTALSHSGWAMSIAWILVVCVTNNAGFVNKLLSWKYIYPLSRLTYCAYLIHPTLTRALILHGESSLHLTHSLVAILFFGIVIASYLASLILSLLVEAPMVSLLRIAHPLRRWKNK